MSTLRELPWRALTPVIRVLDDRVQALAERVERHTAALQVGTEAVINQRYAALDGRLATLAEQQLVVPEVFAPTGDEPVSEDAVLLLRARRPR
jgi:hypothetical protein